jgi:hypothetical protein
MMQYTHPGRSANCIQQKHDDDVLDKVTYHLEKNQNISMPIEKEQQIMLGNLQPNTMNGNPLEENSDNKKLDRPSDSRKRKKCQHRQTGQMNKIYLLKHRKQPF